MQSSAVLASSSSTASSPAADGSSPTGGASAGQQGGDSPQPESHSSPSTFQKAPRAWGVVAQTHEQHLEEYPTAAEAAKKSQELHDLHHATNATSSSNGQNHAAKRTPHLTSTTSGEPMAKTVSAISSGGDNWDEVDEDEGVDFLNAEAIEFADGSVVVASAVTHTSDTTNTSAPNTAPTSHQEEKIVDRGDVDFNRAWPGRASQDSTQRYPAHDRAHPPLWQGTPTDRRPSADRTPYPSQRRESFGSREHYQGGPRRESLGPKEPFPGSRRDSAGYRDTYDRRDAGSHRDAFDRRDSHRDTFDRRDSYNRSGSYSRDREPLHHREGDFTRDRRPSYDRMPHTTDRPTDWHQRDVQLLTRSKDGPHDRPGPHDAVPVDQKSSGHPHPPTLTPLANARGPHEPVHAHDPESRVPSYAHLIPPGAVEYDRPAQVTEDQREAMKHAAEEARKRREEEEKKFEEARARARARADELAKKAEEAKLAKEKEEEAAREAERLVKAKAEEEEAARKKASQEAAAAIVAAASPPTERFVPGTVREFGDARTRPPVKNMTESDKMNAMAQWQALPERLAKEKTEAIAHIREQDRLEQERKQATQPRTDSDATDAAPSTSGAAPWRRSGQSVMGKRDEKPKEVAKAVANGPHIALHTAPQEVRVEQLDKVMHRIEESFQARGTSVQALGAHIAKPDDNQEPAKATAASQEVVETQQPLASGVEKTRTRNAKAARAAEKEAWRRNETRAAVVEGKPIADITVDRKDDSAQESGKTGPATPSAIESSTTIGKGNYPAKLNGVHGTVRISDISRIHARLSRQSAGDLDLETPVLNQPEGNSSRSGRRGPGLKAGHKATDSSPKRGVAVKRDSFTNTTTPTIFPSNVEQAAKKRGSMSFMVESEIDGGASGPDGIVSDQHPTPSSSQEANARNTAIPNKQEQVVEGESKALSLTTPFDPAFGAELSGIETYGGSSQPAATMAPMNQHMWSMPLGSDASSQAPTTMAPSSMIMTGPAGTSAGHPVQPYQMVMSPYYPQGYPVNGPHVYYMYPPRGPMPPPHPQYNGGPMPIAPGSLAGSAGSQSTAEMASTPDLAMDSMGMGMSTLTTTADSNTTTNHTNNASSILGPHHWLPRFSAAGDAPPQQAGVSGGSFLVPVHVSQQASIIAAANINRAPQPRPYVHHLPGQQNIRGLNPGSVSLESSFQDGSNSPTSTDGWSSNTTMATGSTASTSPSNSNGRSNHIHSQNASGLSPTSLAPGTGRMNYGNYPSVSPTPLSNHHHHPNHPNAVASHHRGGGGRGGFQNSYGSYREFKPRGGYGAGRSGVADPMPSFSLHH
ncbi:hypothetical protein BGZ70_010150 [Mortierella alpina]|uniref:Uncharacterized protein n=1 Tax=Mortierella alpina TaxID=64518 RepID=A0A9P6JCW9_MORAP|nr:hypothetical protein BGZ70_010150 [Mortierella alpina]